MDLDYLYYYYINLEYSMVDSLPSQQAFYHDK